MTREDLEKKCEYWGEKLWPTHNCDLPPCNCRTCAEREAFRQGFGTALNVLHERLVRAEMLKEIVNDERRT